MGKGKELVEKAKQSDLYQHPLEKSKELASVGMEKAKEFAPSKEQVKEFGQTAMVKGQ
jgi:hypothetical protein